MPVQSLYPWAACALSPAYNRGKNVPEDKGHDFRKEESSTCHYLASGFTTLTQYFQSLTRTSKNKFKVYGSFNPHKSGITLIIKKRHN